MKKIITILVTTVFVLVTTSMAVADGRGHFHGHYQGHHHGQGYRSHVHYYGSGDLFWFGLGMGVLTGIVASNAYNDPYVSPSDVYYEPSTVVTPPAYGGSTPSRFGKALSAEYGTVSVTAAELNLRSGPGLDHSVTGAVPKGTVLAVIESIKDWFYIRTPDGFYGWVMDKYTTPARPVG